MYLYKDLDGRGVVEAGGEKVALLDQPLHLLLDALR